MPNTYPLLEKCVAFITMGCAKNEVDSLRMAEALAQSGYSIIDDPEQADVVIVNTCSFIQAATEESIEAILEVADLPNFSCGSSKLIVAGCMPARYEGELNTEFPEVSDFIECSEEQKIVSRVDEVAGVERIEGARYAVVVDGLQNQGVSSYVKISDGCNRFCSYCTIPYIRGRYHSFTYEEIENEVTERIRGGAREIVLIAQDTGRWGDDFEQPDTLAGLLEKLAVAHADTWFRVMYIQPEGITDDLIEAVACHDNICSYFDIPFQHVNSDLLKSMNRKGSRDEYLMLIESLRVQIPDVTLRTTLIAGFPGETDEMFEELCDFVEEACLDYVGVFAYSREEGTKAFGLPNQVDEDEKLYRAQRLRDLADDVSSSVIHERVGKRCKVLVCGAEEDGQLFGRTQAQAPDVDGVTYVSEGHEGDFIDIVIEDTLLYEMEGEAV